MDHKKFIQVNELLGKTPSIGPLAANQIIPIVVIFVLSYFITNSLLGLSMYWVGFTTVWLVATWLLLTGKDPDRYLKTFNTRPLRWTFAGVLYISPLYSPKKRSSLLKKSQFK